MFRDCLIGWLNLALVPCAYASQPARNNLARARPQSPAAGDIAVGMASIFSVQTRRLFCGLKNFRPPGRRRQAHQGPDAEDAVHPAQHKPDAVYVQEPVAPKIQMRCC